MKAACNGVPSLSILDGWSLEDAASHYDKLARIRLPLYYRAGVDPDGWVALMTGAIGKNASYFNSHRRIRRYATESYLR